VRPRVAPARAPAPVVALLSLALAACAEPPPLILSPAGSPSPTCPAEGCSAQAPPTARATASDPACPALADGTCGASQPADCTDRALDAWSEAHDDRQLGCVAALMERACSLDDARGCAYAGRLRLDGRGVARDVARGLQMLLRACDEGVAMACAAGARWTGEALNASDTPDAPELFARMEAQRTCLLGQGDACFQVGLLFYFGRESYPRDRARAAAAFARGCDAGDARACGALGRSLAFGDGVARATDRAAVTLAKACKYGDGLGCSTLGLLAERGDGVARDPSRARVLYRAGCSAGDVYGCLHADMLAASGASRARRYAAWTAACARGEGRACAFVGMLIEDGSEGLARDEAKSLEWAQRACDLGETRACDWVKSRPED
jgi:TPR repeat protein